MEIPCRVYISKVDELYAGESGWVTIKKNDVVYIPDMCLHKKPTIALHRTTNDVGFVNLSNFDIAMGDGRERVNTIFAHGVAVKDFDHTKPGNWLSYNIGHLILLSPGPWLKGVERCHETAATEEGPFVKVFNLTTVDIGFVPFKDFHWFPNAEVLREKEIFYVDQGKYAGERPMYSKVGEKLVVIWAPKMLASVSRDQMFHGIRASTGTVGWWRGLRKIDKHVQQIMQVTVEAEAQRRMPEGSNLQELVQRWAALNRGPGAAQMPGMQAHGDIVKGALPALIAGPGMPLMSSNINLTARSSMPSTPSDTNQAAGPSMPSMPPNTNLEGNPLLPSQLQMAYPENIKAPSVYMLTETVPEIDPPGSLPNTPRPAAGQPQEEEFFGPHAPAPKWDWPPGVRKYNSEADMWAENAEAQMTGEEIVKFPWRKVHEYEMNLKVGEKLTLVAKADYPNRWGLNCWWAVPASGGQQGMIPSRVVGATDKSDETRNAEIYDMAVCRGGTCVRHPAHDRYLRCCVSFTGPHPTFETCVLRDQGYISRMHFCCTDDWSIAGEAHDSGIRGVFSGDIRAEHPSSMV
ncbi:hypothetical protein L211DRAFT_847182 [Terfezia boudieri ATCC MYA-4762]|uniref:SH3 domain-containing protein n=1 Tax=Terfezia boudieri ATCC MYA-4762 TaxID=1051890 RepID=A0A3N4LZK2_9PEZI|nr:hypothetical protein L211DRAFT_847182 [Terfezia boudieri ATCC MYA-4762]